jgi:hypothetical protein
VLKGISVYHDIPFIFLVKTLKKIKKMKFVVENKNK